VKVDGAATLRKAFPAALAPDVLVCVELMPESKYPPTGPVGPIQLRGEVLELPHRIYSPEPRDAVSLSLVQQKLLSCLYTRHHDGVVRQRNLERLLPSVEPWIAPFVVQLLGEYVIEILEVLAAHLADLRTGPYSEFVAENAAFLALTKKRMISYWDCYYRQRFPVLGDYVGMRVFEALTGGAIRGGGSA
jgi:hypothetical protein